MKFFVRNKVASIGGSSRVYDENNNDIFKVKGKVFSITRKKKIYDMDGKLLYIVKNKFWNFWTRSSFVLDANKHKIARVKSRAFKSGFDILGYGDQIAIDGFTLGGYKIIVNSEQVGSVKSNILSLADNFEVEINDGQDPAFIVSLIIAIDNVRDKLKQA